MLNQMWQFTCSSTQSNWRHGASGFAIYSPGSIQNAHTEITASVVALADSCASIDCSVISDLMDRTYCNYSANENTLENTSSKRNACMHGTKDVAI